jgi:hypothetical protein
LAFSWVPVATMLPWRDGIPAPSNNLVAPSIAAALRCMYRFVVARSWCQASS